MPQITIPTIELYNGVALPQLGFGTYRIVEQSDMDLAVFNALKDGYRLFDTAQLYQNEQQLGKAIKNSGYKRDDILITSKVHNDNQGYDNTLNAIDQILQDLQTDYVDFFLVHWPLSDTFFETWRALERIYDEKLAKAIGVCNFEISHLELLSTKANIKPMMNQIELHPFFNQSILVQYLKHEEIAVQCWSPIVRGKVNEVPQLIDLASKYNKTPIQITLRWHIQHGYSAIPKSSNPDRIKQNTAILDFQLTTQEMTVIDSLNQNLRTGKNPNDVYRNNGF